MKLNVFHEGPSNLSTGTEWPAQANMIAVISTPIIIIEIGTAGGASLPTMQMILKPAPKNPPWGWLKH